jgi:MFS family permease
MTDSDQTMQDEQGIQFGPKKLNLWMEPGVSRLNVRTLLFGSFFGIAMMSFINTCQAYLFEEVLLIPQNQQGVVAGNMTFYSEIIVILSIGLIGAMSDKVGRKPLWVAAFVILSIGYFLYPLARTVDELTLYRMLFAFGLAANTAMLPSVANDYPAEKCRGKMIAVCFTLNGLGFIMIMAPIQQLLGFYENMTGGDAALTAKYWIWTASAICLFVSTGLAFGLKSGVPAQLEKKDGFFASLKIAFRAGKRLRVALAYTAAIVARGDMAVLSTFFVLWLTQVGVNAGMETAAAAQRGLLFYILIQVFALCWLPILGLILDRIDRVLGLALAMILAAVGYFSLFMLADPLGPMIWVCAVLVGIGEMSANLASLTLIGSEAPVKGRGAVIGLFSLCGAIGILLVAKVGGTLSATLGPVAPFVLVAAANIAVLVLALLVWKFAKKPAAGAGGEGGIAVH